MNTATASNTVTKTRASYLPAKVSKPKPKFSLPITTLLTKHEHLILKIPIHISMKFLAQGIAQATDWYNINFRIVIGLRLAELLYTDEVIKEFKHRVEISEGIWARFKETKVLQATQEEIEYLSSAMTAVDTMQDTDDRRSLIYVSRKAYTYMQKFRK